MAWGPAWTDTGYVFVREDGLPYFPEHFSTAWERHINRLDLRPIRLHDARHTAATLALAAGEKIEVVSKWLGHANVAITQQIYAHVLPSMLEDTGERLTQLIFAKRNSVDIRLTRGAGTPHSSRESAGQRAGGEGIEPSASGSKVRRSAN